MLTGSQIKECAAGKFFSNIYIDFNMSERRLKIKYLIQLKDYNFVYLDNYFTKK